MRPLLLIVCAVLAAGGTAIATADHAAESRSRPAVAADARPSVRGAAAFVGAGFGGISMEALERNAVPWRVVATALVLDERRRDPAAPLTAATLDKVLARFGFLSGARVDNLPAVVGSIDPSLPLGMTHGDIAPIGGSTVRVANLGCAACHAGVTYAADGRPRPARAMLGMPNSSLDLEAYTLAVFQALRRHIASPELLPAAQALFPNFGGRELASARLIVLPLARRRLAALGQADRPLPFTNGAPGSTNGVAALKHALGVPLIDGGAGVVSIPDLGDRVWRSDLLVDGVYAVPGAAIGATSGAPDAARLKALAAITTFFTVPSMGVHPDTARASLADAEAIMAFLKDYRAQRFPGRIDQTAASRGQAIFARDCAACHGRYDASLDAPRLMSFPNWRGNVGSDPRRAADFDRGLADAVARTRYRDVIAVRTGRDYVAPPLAGLWASAPYLHNGSVPTLAALLTPGSRPPRFLVGGHALDFVSVGIRLIEGGRYPSGYRPFSTPAWTDTSAPGRSNAGHRFGGNLSDPDKRALIEYLKLL